MFIFLLLLLTWYQVHGIVARGLWPSVTHSCISVHGWDWSIIISDVSSNLVGTCMPVDTCMYEQLGSLTLMDVEVLEYEHNRYMRFWDEREWIIWRYSILMKLAILGRNIPQQWGLCERFTCSWNKNKTEDKEQNREWKENCCLVVSGLTPKHGKCLFSCFVFLDTYKPTKPNSPQNFMSSQPHWISKPMPLQGIHNAHYSMPTPGLLCQYSLTDMPFHSTSIISEPSNHTMSWHPQLILLHNAPPT